MSNDLIRPLVDRVEDAITGLNGAVVLRWGTVVQATPLSVRLDAEDAPLPFPPICPLNGLKAGERVLCAIQNRRVTVLTVSGLTKTAPATQTEVNAGTDTTRYVTAKSLRERDYAPYAAAAGALVTSTAGATAVTLPSSRFSQQPRVVSEVVDHPNVCVSHTRGVTAASFVVSAYTIGGGIVAATVHWQAVQMTSSSGSG